VILREKRKENRCGTFVFIFVDACCVLRGAWCVVCGVWCVVCGAWCVLRIAYCVLRVQSNPYYLFPRFEFGFRVVFFFVFVFFP
jgi:hypothetical protein